MASRYLPRLMDALAKDGIPTVGAADLGAGESPRFRVDYDAAATQAQRDAGAAIVAAFDLSDTAQSNWETTQNRALAKSMAIRDRAMAIYFNIQLNQLRTQANQKTAIQTLAGINQVIDAGTAD